MDLTLIARGMGVSIRYGTPPGGWWGLWSPQHRTILLRQGLAPKQWRYALSHELAHAHYQHRGHSPEHETAADLYAARTLVSLARLKEAMLLHQCHLTVADHLEVYPHLIRLLLENAM